MKRYGNLYEQIYDIENLRKAFKNAKRGKGWYEEVLKISENEDKYLLELQGMLLNKTYKTSEYEIFQKDCGNKIREIYKLPFFPDRICQWSILLIIEDIFIKNFVRDTYSAIPNRGIHLALKRMKREIKEDTEGMKYCLKIDVKKYYPNINHEILKQKLCKIFKDKDLLWLLSEIIDSIDGETGLPIGNYTSQYLGNFYLSEFDHWIKENKRIKHYFRYMDDCCIFSNSKEDLHRLKLEIDDYLMSNLKLKLKSNWQIFPVEDRGVDFVGYVVRKDYILLRKSIKQNMKKKAKKLNKKKTLDFSDKCTINSYKGWLKYCDSYNLYNKHIKPLENKLDK